MSTTPVLVFVTFTDLDEATAVARALVAEHLAAGANLLPVARSVYLWKGEVCEHPEVLMVAESTRERFEALRERVLALHSYEVPKIVSVDIAQGHPPYLDWLRAHSRPG
ncbi:MAG: divalent-cation tolerance protein CutA [Alphaproteobacteria bacterium]|nr:divalent-cation tolerance protein CutA [Alphaproteobacteria bacterium]